LRPIARRKGFGHDVFQDVRVDVRRRRRSRDRRASGPLGSYLVRYSLGPEHARSILNLQGVAGRRADHISIESSGGTIRASGGTSVFVAEG
jgi:hypothetical protein